MLARGDTKAVQKPNANTLQADTPPPAGEYLISKGGHIQEAKLEG